MKKIELIETTAVDRGLNAGRPATNTDPPPPMSATTYTMFVGNDAGYDAGGLRAVLLQHAYEFRKGRAVTDEDFARPHAKGEGVT